MYPVWWWCGIVDSKGILDRNQQPGWRFPPMKTMAMYIWSRWAFKFEYISCGLTYREMGSAQNTLCINEYIFSFQLRYVKGTGQVVRCTATRQPHPVMGLVIIMMTMNYLWCCNNYHNSSKKYPHQMKEQHSLTNDSTDF